MQEKEDWKTKRLTWDEKNMMAVIIAASRSSCVYLHTGAVVVKNKRIKAEGYNGAGKGIQNCLEKGCRKEEYGIAFEIKGTGNCRGTHAEANALDEVSDEIVGGSTLYTLYYPCSDCAKRIANRGVIEVVYCKIYKEPSSLTKELFKERGIIIRKLELDFEKCQEVQKETFYRK